MAAMKGAIKMLQKQVEWINNAAWWEWRCFFNNKPNTFEFFSLAVCFICIDYGGFPVHRYKGWLIHDWWWYKGWLIHLIHAVVAFRKGSDDHIDGCIKYIELYQQVLEHLDGQKSHCFLLKKAHLNEAFPA